MTVRIIVGLGNPGGARYAQTRHNLGFWVLDALSLRWQLPPLAKHRFQARCGEGLVGGDKRVILVKPPDFYEPQR